KNDCENVWTRQDCSRISHRVTFVQRQRESSGLRARRATHVATGFGRADQRTAIATDAGPAGVLWLIVRQEMKLCGPHVSQVTPVGNCETCVGCGLIKLLSQFDQ